MVIKKRGFSELANYGSIEERLTIFIIGVASKMNFEKIENSLDKVISLKPDLLNRSSNKRFSQVKSA
jgi:hypothetical protein